MSHDRDYADPGIKWNVMGCEDRETECVVSRGDRGNRSVDSDPGGESGILGIGDEKVQKTLNLAKFGVRVTSCRKTH